MPTAERHAERRRLLVEAAYELLGTAGITGTTVRGVCESTRLNPRYFYESFADLDALLVAVYDEVATDAYAAMAEAGAVLLTARTAPDPYDLSHATVGAFVRHVTSDPRRARVLFLEGLGNESLARRRTESMRSIAALIEHGAAAEHPGATLDSAVRVGANVVVGGMAELMIAWLNGTLDVSIERLIDDAATIFTAIGLAATHRAEQRDPA